MTIQVTDREWATVLAALRYWQQALVASKGEASLSPDHFDVTLTPLTADEVGDLCERLNRDPLESAEARQLISLTTPIQVWPRHANLPVTTIALVGRRRQAGEFVEVAVHGLVLASGGFLSLPRLAAVMVSKAKVAVVQDVGPSSLPNTGAFLG